ncbi:MAG: hypothetical protein Q7R40_14380 [Phaeospirillum sp.]|nr:hypothetical protein [Phaeospirillum sp.]
MSILQLQDSIDELTVEELRTLVDIMHGATQQRHDNFWLTMNEKNTLFSGQQGTGKTASMVKAAHEIQRLTEDRPKTGAGVTTIGPKLGLKPKFGPSTELGYDGFIDQLVRISEAAAAPEAKNPDATVRDLHALYERHGVTIYGNVLVADEAGNLFGKRRVMSSIGQIVAEFGQTLRHVHATLLIASPRGELDLDDKICVQLHYVGRPAMKIFTDDEEKVHKTCQLYIHRAGLMDSRSGSSFLRARGPKLVQSFPIEDVAGLYVTDQPVELSPHLITKFRKKFRKAK